MLPLRDVCLFPEASLAVVVNRRDALAALEVAARSGRCVLAVAQRDPSATDPQPARPARHGHAGLPLRGPAPSAKADGASSSTACAARRVVTLIGVDTLVAEVEPLDEGDPGDEWGAAVEALARYLHAHADLRSFLDQQRRSREPMAWVNLACQHLPITASARQKLLESDALERCLKISRGLDALLRKEQGA